MAERNHPPQLEHPADPFVSNRNYSFFSTRRQPTVLKADLAGVGPGVSAQWFLMLLARSVTIFQYETQRCEAVGWRRF